MTAQLRHDARKALNHKHSENPEPGDYWSERSVPYLVILDTIKSGGTRHYLVFDKIIHRMDGDAFDITAPKLLSEEQFLRKIKYETRDDFVADVTPGGCLEYVDMWKES